MSAQPQAVSSSPKAWLRQAHSGCKRRSPKALRSEGFDEPLDRIRMDRFCAATGDRPCTQVSLPLRLLPVGPETRFIGEIGSPAVRNGKSRHRFKPPQRSPKKRDGRHQIGGNTCIKRGDDSMQQSIIMEIRQPAERPATVRHSSGQTQGLAMRQHISMADHDAARSGRRS